MKCLLILLSLSAWADEANLKNKPMEYWEKRLTPEQLRICRKRGTEEAFEGDMYKKKENGVYRCSSCEHALFGSEQKYDAGSPWPTFTAPIESKAVETEKESGFFGKTYVRCAHCGAYLGVLTDKGPAPSHVEYRINAHCLNFEGAGRKKGKKK